MKRLDVRTVEQRRLLALLAGFADAGCDSPSFTELFACLKGAGVRKHNRTGKAIDSLLDELVAEELVEVEWAGDADAEPENRGGESGKRNRYALGEWAR